MEVRVVDEALSRFQTLREDYERFAKLLRGFLEARLLEIQRQARSLPLLHSVTCRVKSVESLRKKLARWNVEGRFASGSIDLGSIDDLAGVRVIFYFKDDMEKFLENDFDLIFGRRTRESVDKKVRNLDSFGYQSVHFTVSHALNSLFTESLREEDKNRFQWLKAEVQVRTILQHAWAETAHDLLYKRVNTGIRTPQEVQAERLYNAMAATLELLDERLLRQKQLLTSSPEPTQEIEAPIGSREGNDVGANASCTLEYLGIAHPYTILHNGTLMDLKHREDRTLYDSSQAFGISHYKGHVWAHLVKTAPDFVRSLAKHDATCVRVKAWSEDESCLTVQPAVYSDQITTNHRLAHDCELPSGKTVRDHALALGELLPLAESPLANTLGVSLVIRTSEDYWVVARRRAGLSMFSELLGPPVSGVVQWRESGSWQPGSFAAWIQNSVLVKCDQELGILPGAHLLVYLGLTREAQRLGKPQMFFFLDLLGASGGYSAGHIASRYRIYRRDDEYSALDFLEPRVVEKVVRGEYAGQERVGQFSSELVMNLALAHQYLARTVKPNAE